MMMKRIAVLLLLSLFPALSPGAETDKAAQELQQLVEQAKQLEEDSLHDKALPLAREALLKSERLNGKDSAATANILILLGHIQLNVDDDAENLNKVEACFSRALKIYESNPSVKQDDLARALSAMAIVPLKRNDFANALSLLQKALAIFQKSPTPDHLTIARTMNTIAILYNYKNEKKTAELYYQKAIALAEKHTPPSGTDDATYLYNLAEMLRDGGDFARAEKNYLRALEVLRTRKGDHRQDTAECMHSLGVLYDDLPDFRRAETMLKGALKIFEELHGRDHRDTNMAVLLIATLYHKQGDLLRAKEYYERALKSQDAQPKPNQSLLASILNNYAVLTQILGDYEYSARLNQRALEIREKREIQDPGTLASSLINLGEVYRLQGDYDRTESLLRRAIAILEPLGRDGYPSLSLTFNNLAALYYHREQYEVATKHYRRALELAEKFYGSEHEELSVPLSNLAILSDIQGRFDEAEELYRRALGLLEKTRGPKHPKLVSELISMAEMNIARSDLQQAEALLARSESILSQNFDPNHPEWVIWLLSKAKLRIVQGQYVAALPLLWRTLTNSEQRLRREGYSLSESRLSRLLALLRREQDFILTLLSQHPDDAQLKRLALSMLLLRQGRSLDEAATAAQSLQQRESRPTQELFRKLQSLRSRLSNLLFSSADEQGGSRRKQEIKELTIEADLVEQQLAKTSAGIRARLTLPQPARIQELVGKVLPGDSALVVIAAYHEQNWKARNVREAVGEPRYLAMVLGQDGSLGATALGPVREIDKEVERLRLALSNPKSDYLASAIKTHDLVFKPLAGLIGTRARLFLSLDGQLNLLPFAALHDGQGFLLDRRSFNYLTSGRDLLRRSVALSSNRSVLLLADPAFTEAALPSAPLAVAELAKLQRGIDIGPLPPLPGTRQEAELIRSQFPQSLVLQGRGASEAALLTVSAPAVLHVATHAFFLEDAKRDLFDDRRGLVLSSAAAAPNPLLRSGLVLAGAKLAAARGSDGGVPGNDGIATALEMSGMNLWGTQLVVLSACDTGRGEVHLGQGVYGMRRAVMVAGAETLVTSLWRVSDDATQRLMGEYYQRLRAGAGRVDAMQAAAKSLRASADGRFGHPYYWASFVVIGKGDPLRAIW